MIWWGITESNARLEVRGGGCTPSEAGKFCSFETRIVQFGEYFWGANLAQAMSKNNNSIDLTDTNFCVLGEILVKILLESLKISHFSFFFF